MSDDAFDVSRAITFGENPLDRRSEKRDDAAEIAAARSDPRGRYAVFFGDQILLADGTEDPTTHDPDAAAALGADTGSALLLGWLPDGAPRFAARLAAAPEARNGLSMTDLRSLAAEPPVGPAAFGQLAQARSMLSWHERHGFCANCGAPTVVGAAGYRRECPSCGTQHFPRVDPVAIMLVSDGDRALLGRQARFKPGNYSCLAGFVEPGETLEDAVRREVFEEAGIRVGRVSFHASQPWPFVSSLMLGCLGEALSTEIDMDEAELEDCRWFHRDEIAEMLAGTHAGGLYCPPKLAIARHLIERWMSK